MQVENNYDVTHLPLAKLGASPTQPRKTFHEAHISKLADSIQEGGLLHPIRVRPMPGLFAGDASTPLYEIIYGECRFRAFQLLGRDNIPCNVVDWSDKRVVEAQLIENLQRKDIDPIEESEGYHAALALLDASDQPVFTVNSLAQKVGTSSNYIRERLLFRELPDFARKALLEAVIGISHARIIARIPTEISRQEAALRIIKPDFQVSPLTARDAQDLVRRDYMRELKRAPFDQNDAALVPHMGACTTCKFRTGNDAGLYGEVQRGDVCTYPDCFNQKKEAVWTRATAAARESGARILTAAESETLFNDDGKLVWNCDYVRLGDQPSPDLVRSTTKRLATWKQVLSRGQAKVQVYLARTPRGAVHELALRREALVAAQLMEPDLFIGAPKAPTPLAAHPPLAKPSSETKPVPSQGTLPIGEEPTVDHEAERLRAERAKTRLELAVLKQVVATLVQRIEEEAGEDESLSAPFWQALLPLAVAHSSKEGWGFVADRRGLDPSIFKEVPTDAAMMLWGDLSSFELPAIVVELLLGPYLRFQGGEKSPLLAPLLSAYSIDVENIRRNVTASFQSKVIKTKETSETHA